MIYSLILAHVGTVITCHNYIPLLNVKCVYILINTNAPVCLPRCYTIPDSFKIRSRIIIHHVRNSIGFHLPRGSPLRSLRAACMHACMHTKEEEMG